MIQQPELGRKIYELRKARGLTQEELVEKCNLSVRTLQRIEAGEVEPRPSTLKLIFEALEIPYDHSLNSNGLFRFWLGQFYIRFIDLFNLKTNTMRKITILIIMIAAVVTGILAINNATSAQESKNKAADPHIITVGGSNTNPDTEFSYFFSEESFYDGNELIARNAKFTCQGVTIASTLIKLNQETQEFMTSFASGKLSEEKAEINLTNDLLEKIHYTADMIDTSSGQVHLRGNAKVDAGENRIIQAQEIVITIE